MTDTRNMTLRNLTDYCELTQPNSMLVTVPNGLLRELKENTDTLVKALEKIGSENTQWDWTDKDTAEAALGKIATQMRALAREALAKMQLQERDYSPPTFDQQTAPPLTMRSALEQIKIVCVDNAATTVRHDLALEFVGGIASRALSRQPPQSSREG